MKHGTAGHKRHTSETGTTGIANIRGGAGSAPRRQAPSYRVGKRSASTSGDGGFTQAGENESGSMARGRGRTNKGKNRLTGRGSQGLRG